MARQEIVTKAAVRMALQTLGEGGKPVSSAMLFEAMGVNTEQEKARIRSQISSMIHCGEVRRIDAGVIQYVFDRRPRPSKMRESMWRFVRAAKPGWSLQDCALMTRASYACALRYVTWLEGQGLVARMGRNDRRAIIYRNTPKAQAMPEAPNPSIKMHDSFERERVAGARITRLLLCADLYSPGTARQIREACKILTDRFGMIESENFTELENREDSHVE